MNIVIINCFDTYEDRIDLVYDFLKSNNHKVKVVQSNFRHFKKSYRKEKKKDFIFVDTKSYYKNISIKRLLSHYFFAKKAFEIVEDIQPDLIYTIVPPNFTTKFASLYTKKNKDVKLVFDIIDLWPETMPIGLIKKIPPFTFWRNMRDKNLKQADFIITECDLYQKVLDDKIQNIKTETLYLAKKDIEIDLEADLSEKSFDICYLGSINNIIDIDLITSIISQLNKLKPTTLHIIGDGENKDKLISSVKKSGAQVNFYGEIYDSKEKQNIFKRCHFGLNIMKSNVCVGLTMKSIDYFQFGLPIINNIGYDTEEIVENNKVGFNIINGKIDKLINNLKDINNNEYKNMRYYSRNVYEKHFSIDSFNKKLSSFNVFSKS
jgi:glycosyltransferase involved in cell wall biosynthesis